MTDNGNVSQAADGANALVAFAADILAQIPTMPLDELPSMLARAIEPIHAATRSFGGHTSVNVHYSRDEHESVFVSVNRIETYAAIRRSGQIIAETRTGDSHNARLIERIVQQQRRGQPGK